MAGREIALRKKETKLDQWLRLIEISFPERFPHPDKQPWGISSHMNTYQSGRNRPRKKPLDYVCVILSSYILKFYLSQTREKVSIPEAATRRVLQKKLFLKISQHLQENTSLESPFNRLAGFKTWNISEKRLQHICFPVNVIKFLRTLILKKICEQLLLPFLHLTVNISSQGLVCALNSIVALQGSSSRFKEISLGCLAVGSSFLWKKGNLAKMVTCCHSLSFVDTRYHSLYHSLSLVVPLVDFQCHLLYHSLSLDVPLICLFINDHGIIE